MRSGVMHELGDETPKQHCRKLRNTGDLVAHLINDHDSKEGSLTLYTTPFGRLDDMHHRLHNPQPKSVTCPTCGSVVPEGSIKR